MSAVLNLARTLERADLPSAKHVFLRRDDARLFELARSFDTCAAHGLAIGPLAGRIVVIKGNIDVQGFPTNAGSRSFTASPPADSAPLVQNLVDSGGVPMGQANMSEFAFSGLGLNPHFGTARNALDPDLVPGGSSSGCATAVSLGIADMAIGTDTSGSTRVPAACQGIYGFRPTMGRYNGQGIVPLAPSLDTPGPMARNMISLLQLDMALRRETTNTPDIPLPRLIVPEPKHLEPLHPEIRAMFACAARDLAYAGHRIEVRALPVLDDLGELFRRHGTLVAVEAPETLAGLADLDDPQIDPVIRQRLKASQSIAPAAAAHIRAARATLKTKLAKQLDGDLLILPTLSGPPPRLRAVQDNREAFATENARILRLSMLGAYLDMPSLAMPCGTRPGHSLTLAGVSGDDDRVLWTGQQIEPLLSPLASEVLA